MAGSYVYAFRQYYCSTSIFALIQREIELSLLYVSLCDNNPYGVSKLVFMPVVAAYEAIVTLVKVVIIVIKVVQRHHSLAMVLVNLAIYAVRGYAADVGIVSVAYRP